MRLQSSGIPAHRYGHAYESWTDLVLDQQWDITIPIISGEEETDEKQALRHDVDPTEFLVTAAREERPLGMALLNGVPFFSPLTPAGTSTTVSHTRQTRVEATLWRSGMMAAAHGLLSVCLLRAHGNIYMVLNLGVGMCSFLWDVEWGGMAVP